MRFDLSLGMTPSFYEFRSLNAGLSEKDTPLCMTVMIKGKECFLSIGEPESDFLQDPGYQRARARQELRWFNPFDAAHFEQRNAFLVVYAYMRRAHRKLRERINPWFHDVIRMFWDKCVLTLTIDGYDSISVQKRNDFEMALLSVRTFRQITINSRTIASRPSRPRCGHPKAET